MVHQLLPQQLQNQQLQDQDQLNLQRDQMKTWLPKSLLNWLPTSKTLFPTLSINKYLNKYEWKWLMQTISIYVSIIYEFFIFCT